MSTATADRRLDPPMDGMDNADDYRALHTGALLGLLIAIVSLVFPISISSFSSISSAAPLGVVPAVGLILSLWSLGKIRSSPDLYTGRLPAQAGALIAAASLFVGGGYGSFVYATEVPDGYQRISFLRMKPDRVEEAGRQAIPPDIEELLGEKIFIKGFIRPDSTNSGLRKGISSFLLVRDNNQCCFGDVSQVKYYDQISVDLEPGLTADYASRVFRLGGELTCRPGNVARSEPPLVYMLEADYLK